MSGRALAKVLVAGELYVMIDFLSFSSLVKFIAAGLRPSLFFYIYSFFFFYKK